MLRASTVLSRIIKVLQNEYEIENFNTLKLFSGVEVDKYNYNHMIRLFGVTKGIAPQTKFIKVDYSLNNPYVLKIAFGDIQTRQKVGYVSYVLLYNELRILDSDTDKIFGIQIQKKDIHFLRLTYMKRNIPNSWRKLKDWIKKIRDESFTFLPQNPFV